jgi:hypothetical protein
MSNYLSGEPDAGKPPVRFGGRGKGLPCSDPYQIQNELLSISP